MLLDKKACIMKGLNKEIEELCLTDIGKIAKTWEAVAGSSDRPTP